MLIHQHRCCQSCPMTSMQFIHSTEWSVFECWCNRWVAIHQLSASHSHQIDTTGIRLWRRTCRLWHRCCQHVYSSASCESSFLSHHCFPFLATFTSTARFYTFKFIRYMYIYVILVCYVHHTCFLFVSIGRFYFFHAFVVLQNAKLKYVCTCTINLSCPH